jgi:DNA modification methylase
MMLPINQVITGNCIEVMANWEPESIGLIFTSPPYNVGLNYDGYQIAP